MVHVLQGDWTSPQNGGFGASYELQLRGKKRASTSESTVKPCTPEKLSLFTGMPRDAIVNQRIAS